MEYTQEELSALILKRSGIDYGQIIDLIPIARGTSGRLWKTEDCGNQAHAHHRQGAGNSPYALYFTPLQLCLRGGQGGVVLRGIPGRFILTGAGWGHGVGLCQIGAAVMGEQGYKYDAILLHYYIGASIDKLYE